MALAPATPNNNMKFRTSLVKVFTLKQESNQTLAATIEKNLILPLQENSPMFLQTINFVELRN